ncbi:MAG TPA: hypothetical protein VG672_08915 [Bryobacteraceae bacterium]|jgi:hypothetical protein|nr:hypothetical protein [Bryobacteraceae bacterium]
MSQKMLTIANVVAGVLWLGTLGFGQTPLNGNLRFTPPPPPPLKEPVAGGLSSHYLFFRPSESFVLHPRLEFKLPWNGDQRTFLFGPEFHARILHRVTFNAWLLGGTVKRFALFEPLRQPTDAPPPRFGYFAPPMGQPTYYGANSVAESHGGSVDLTIDDHLTLRMIQAEYLFLKVNDRSQRDRRISTGLRFSFQK